MIKRGTFNEAPPCLIEWKIFSPQSTNVLRKQCGKIFLVDILINIGELLLLMKF